MAVGDGQSTASFSCVIVGAGPAHRSFHALQPWDTILVRQRQVMAQYEVEAEGSR